MDESLRKIWWIASFPKSGNTLVRFFVNAYVTQVPLNINGHYQYATIDQQPQWYQHVAAKPLDQCHPAEIVYLRPAMLMHHCQMVWPRDTCLKTHHAAVEIDGIPLIPARLTKEAVYLIRDPRDVAVSYARHSGRSIDETIGIMANNAHAGDRGNNVKDFIASWSTHVDSWLNIRVFPVHVFQFEDILADKEVAFRQILPALGFRQIDEAKFQFAMEQTDFPNLQRQEREHGFREAKHDRFFHTGKAGQWREILSDEQVGRIETNHRQSMIRAGYEPSLMGVS